MMLQRLFAALLVSVLLGAFVGRSSADSLYGLKSFGPKTGPSSAPTALFRFNEFGSGLVDLGDVKESTTSLDCDGLALSSVHGLLAFRLTPTASQLVEIDSTNASATSRPTTLTGREIRGATFDASGTLWAVDADQNHLLTIDPVTGQVLGTPIGLTRNSAPFNVGDALDIFVGPGGTFYLIHFAKIFELNVLTGEATEVHQETETENGLPFPPAYCGGAFSVDGNPEHLFAFDITIQDDLYRHDLGASYARTLLINNLLPSSNAGRGDLAALPITATDATLTNTKWPKPQAFPNPFDADTTVRFQIPRDGHVLVEVFDPTGRRVRTLTATTLPAGPHSFVWNGRDREGREMSSGVYFVRVVTPSVTQEIKVVRLD